MRSDVVYCGGYKEEPAVSLFTPKMKVAGSSRALASVYLSIVGPTKCTFCWSYYTDILRCTVNKTLNYLPPTSPPPPKQIFMWFEVSIAMLLCVGSNVSEESTAYIFRVEVKTTVITEKTIICTLQRFLSISVENE
jgi:hypothetical protein